MIIGTLNTNSPALLSINGMVFDPVANVKLSRSNSLGQTQMG